MGGGFQPSSISVLTHSHMHTSKYCNLPGRPSGGMRPRGWWWWWFGQSKAFQFSSFRSALLVCLYATPHYQTCQTWLPLLFPTCAQLSFSLLFMCRFTLGKATPIRLHSLRSGSISASPHVRVRDHSNKISTFKRHRSYCILRVC